MTAPCRKVCAAAYVRSRLYSIVFAQWQSFHVLILQQIRLEFPATNSVTPITYDRALRQPRLPALAGASCAGNWIYKIRFARPRWKRGQRGSLYGSKRSNSFFTTA